MEFGDALARLVSREIAEANRCGDADRAAGVVSDLAAQLGTAIALITGGDPGGIEAVLTGAEQCAAEAAAEAAPQARALAMTFGGITREP
jgi:hypothetical protein